MGVAGDIPLPDGDPVVPMDADGDEPGGDMPHPDGEPGPVVVAPNLAAGNPGGEVKHEYLILSCGEIISKYWK